MKEKIQKLLEEALQAISKSGSSEELYLQKVKYLGKQGALTALMKDMGAVPKEERPALGQVVNLAKTNLEAAYTEKESNLKFEEMNLRLQKERCDLSLPGPSLEVGTLHPVTRVIEDMVAIFTRLGFSVRTGPLIEKDSYNFEALNIPKDHPARDMQDTFYVEGGFVLRTQTSPIQIRTLEQEKPPLRILGPGAVFRCDSDVSHAPMFHQMEGMLIDRKVSMSDLKGVLAFFTKEFFGTQTKTRFRPSFFPFTEPSAEVDCSCTVCSGKGCRMCQFTGWVEMGGCGLVHPQVLHRVGLNADEWQGFAFGFGVERLAIMKYGISDIRLFSENDLRFLGQFSRL